MGDALVSSLDLVLDGVDDALDRRLEKGGDLFTSSALLSVSDHDGHRITHPATFSCPKRMPQFASVSLVEPNLMYCATESSLNRIFVVRSKQRTIWSRSSR